MYTIAGPVADIGQDVREFAAKLAARGYTSDPDIIEGRQGYADNFGGDKCNIPAMTKFLGKVYHLEHEGTRIKPWPCCGGNHQTLTNLLPFARELKLKAEEIQLVEGLAAEAKRAGVSFSAQSIGSMFGVYFRAAPPMSFAEVMQCDRSRFNRFFHEMLARGIYLAPTELQWSLFGAPEQFEDNATQSCYWELQKFLAMALKANPNILECLYSPMVEKVTPLGEELLALRQRFLSQMIFQTFNGYAMSQFKKIEQDIRNHGAVRWKHAMHLLYAFVTVLIEKLEISFFCSFANRFVNNFINRT